MKEKEERKEKVLSKKEIIRKEKVEKSIEVYLSNGYIRKDLTVSIAKANIYAVLLWIPFLLVFILLYKLNGHKLDFFNIEMYELAIFLVLNFVLIFIHELLHYVTWGLMNPEKFKSVELGFMKESMTPYCSCTHPLSKGAYLLGSFMPCLVLGIIPSIYSVITGSHLAFLLGQMMIMGAGGDLTIIIKLLGYKPNSSDFVIIDHPTECGLIVLDK